MKISVLSGKGGTGKTFVSTNLTRVASQKRKTLLLDCDVEEPNSGLFFMTSNPVIDLVSTPLPVVDQNRCTHCGICAKKCQFNAIASFPKTTIVYKNLCHGCGVCSMVCPEHAISETQKNIGQLETTELGESLSIVTGRLNVGEPSGVKVIRALKKHIPAESDLVILDSPPGASCPVVETLRGVDFALMVTESSPFGLHDLQIAMQIAEEMKIPIGVVINRYDEKNDKTREFLSGKNIPVLMTIPFDMEIARHYSSQKLLVDISDHYRSEFSSLLEKIEGML